MEKMDFSRLTNLGPFLANTFLNKKTEIIDPEAEVIGSLFLESLELGAFAGLVGGTVLAIRRGSVKPIFNRWGYALGILAIFPANVYFKFPENPSEIAKKNRKNSSRILRDQCAFYGASTLGPLFVIFDATLLAGAQIGLAGGAAAAVGFEQWKLRR